MPIPSLFGCSAIATASPVTSVREEHGLTRPPAVFWELIVFHASRQGGMPPWVVCGAWVICDTVYSRLPLAGQQAHESAVRSLVQCRRRRRQRRNLVEALFTSTLRVE